MSAPYLRSPDLLSRDHCRLLIVDMQEKLVPVMADADALIANSRKLLGCATALDIPVFATEQYPRGLGHTIPELADAITNPPEKLRFSCAEVLAWPPAGEDETHREQVVLAGIEAHVCVLQTAMDLLAIGYRVFVPADAVSSRKPRDWQIALDRLSSHGAVITTTESVLFECCETAENPAFKTISGLVKNG